MNDASLKRKNDVELEEDTCRPKKRLRLDEIILEDISKEQNRPESDIAKRRRKLVMAIQQQKKYKYQCKKHKVAYVVESVRKEVKRFSKKKRDDVPKSSRDLEVDPESSKDSERDDEGDSSESENQADTCRPASDEEGEKSNERCSQKDDKGNADEDRCVKPKTSLVPRKRKWPKKFDVDKNDDWDSDHAAEQDESLDEKTTKPKKSKHRPNFYDLFNQKCQIQDRDSDYETDCPEQPIRCFHRFVKCLVIKKVDAEKIVFGEGQDFVISDSYDCHCEYHNHLLKFNNCEYDSSSSPEEY